MFMNKSLLIKKKELRNIQFKVRKKLFLSASSTFNQKLFDKFFKKINFEYVNIISSYISINSEINTKDLNSFILKNNKKLCLPVVLNKDDHLIFRKFTSEEDMVNGFMNIKEPHSSNEVLIPNVLFVPCLAFDIYGFRLGYGGGYYDRTLSHFKKQKYEFISVGYAFEGQKVSQVPKDEFDMKLDYVITEKKIYIFK